MKMIVLVDEMDLVEGRKVIADNTVRLGWDGTWYELDLTDEHTADLWHGIKPYLDAARKVDAPRLAIDPRSQQAITAAGAGPEVPRYGRVYLWHAVGTTMRDYWKKFRTWAYANGYEIKQHQDKTYSYTVDMVEEYERHLSRLDKEDHPRDGHMIA